MKANLKLKQYISILTIILLFSSCEKYLDKTPDSELSEEDIFGTYTAAQGYIDKNYCFIFDHMSYGAGKFFGFGDDFVFGAGCATEILQRAEYHYLYTSGCYTSIFYKEGPKIWNNDFRYDPQNTNWGIWGSAWIMIRDNNLALKLMEYLTDATQEERDLIEGQALWFRAYHYYLLLINWGGMPYIDKYMEGNEDPYLPRLSTWETVEKIVEDCERAAELLPDDWDNTTVGKGAAGKNLGRITKGAAFGLKALALLEAGSPTCVLESTGELRYDEDHMRRCAEAAWEVIKIANAGVYSLLPWDEYFLQFARNDGFTPWSDETIIASINWRKGDYYGCGQGHFDQCHGRNISPMRFSGNTATANVTQNMVDRFETENGLPIDDPESGYDPMDPWSNRDPRFRGNIIVDGDIWTLKNPEENKFEMYIGGKDHGTVEFLNPFILKKFWPLGVNVYDQQWTEYTASSPVLRLAEVYLIYAEAVNEVYGPNGTFPGASLTAAEAVNMVRQRPGLNMPAVASKFLASKEDFRERIWNERAVELLGENGKRWYDLRRWHVAHLEEYRKCYGIEFDQNHTFFNQFEILEKPFEERYYWAPIKTEYTQIYEGFYQNPGW